MCHLCMELFPHSGTGILLVKSLNESYTELAITTIDKAHITETTVNNYMSFNKWHEQFIEHFVKLIYHCKK